MIYTVGIVFICLFIQTYGEIPPNFTGPRIVGGIKVDNRSTFAYQVSIKYKSRHICGGAILDSNSIVTAAHCCFDSNNKVISANYLTVVVGDLNLFRNMSTTVVRNVQYVFTHEDYSSKTIANDIAIMRIHGTFGQWNSNVQAIGLSPKLPSPSTQCVISGWGLLRQGAKDPSPDLYYARVPIIDKKTCEDAYKNDIKSGMFCAGFMSGNIDACQGDSGGPLVCQNSLTGIVSWGEGCAQPNRPGVYTDVAKYSKWIKKQLKRSSSSETILLSPFIIILATIFHVFLLY